MKRITTLLTCLLTAAAVATAQTSIYSDNFDASITALPTGWYATPNSWSADTSNFSNGYTGASGNTNMQISNATAIVGKDSLISKTISTVGYSNITIEWGARFTKKFADSGSSVKFYYSVDNGSSWINVSFTENANNSIWSIDNVGVPIVLPADASGQAALKLMWLADIRYNPSGTYRIDDLKVAGVATNSVLTVENGSNTMYPNPFSDKLHILMDDGGSHRISVADVTGKQVFCTQTDLSNYSLQTAAYSAGIYLITIQSAHGMATTFRACKQ